MSVTLLEDEITGKWADGLVRGQDWRKGCVCVFVYLSVDDRINETQRSDKKCHSFIV